MAKSRGRKAPGGKKRGGKGGYASADSSDEPGGRGRGGAGKGGQRQQPRGGRDRADKVRRKGGKRRPKAGAHFDDEGFRRTLLADGHRSINEMMSDGNCLFRSLSDQLYGDCGQRHLDVRGEVCDFLEENEDEFAVFLLLDEEEEDVTEFDVYVKSMKEDGEWGGNVELVAAARLYERDITVFSPSGAFSIESGAGGGEGDELLLSYHENGHYNSVHDDRIIQKRNNGRGKAAVAAAEAEVKLAGGPKTKAKKGKGKSSQPPAQPVAPAEGGDPKHPVAADAEDGAKPERPTGAARRGGKDQRENRPRKNDVCPCGSGLRYKKCCLAQEKHQARLAKFKAEHGGEDKKEEEEEKKEATSPDGFKVLKI